MCAAVPNPLNISDLKQYRCILDNVALHIKLTSVVFHIFLTPCELTFSLLHVESCWLPWHGEGIMVNHTSTLKVCQEVTQIS